jgi:mRNA interferase RelE/StbE
MAWRIEVPPHVAEVVRRLPPDVKLAVKAALRGLAIQPEAGEPLQRDLEGLRTFRVRRYRIVYAAERKSRTIQIFAIGHRRGVYEEAARARLRRRR